MGADPGVWTGKSVKGVDGVYNICDGYIASE